MSFHHSVHAGLSLLGLQGLSTYAAPLLNRKSRHFLKALRISVVQNTLTVSCKGYGDARYWVWNRKGLQT